MKPIELTEEHKSKLLEMCKVLFPNDKIDYITNGLIKFLINYYEKPDPNNSKIIFGGWDEIIKIHWFKFCTNEIVNELAWRNIKTDILADCEYEDFRMKLITKIFKDKLVGNNFHIVDYLYKQFKKLK